MTKEELKDKLDLIDFDLCCNKAAMYVIAQITKIPTHVEFTDDLRRNVQDCKLFAIMDIVKNTNDFDDFDEEL